MHRIRVLLLLIPMFLIGNRISAQEVYNYVLQSCSRIVDDPISSITHTRVAQFKKTALIYLSSKAEETMPHVTESFLNEQAYYLSEFVATFFEDVLNGSSKKKAAKKAAEEATPSNGDEAMTHISSKLAQKLNQNGNKYAKMLNRGANGRFVRRTPKSE